MTLYPAVPDCYDPVCQAEQRESDWDKSVEKFPKCALCGDRIFPGEKYHATHGFVVCPSCVEELNENVEIMEDSE